ncbi:hypothetical protein Hanom_Chr04g00358471 [Helianthus anomalus]
MSNGNIKNIRFRWFPFPVHRRNKSKAEAHHYPKIIISPFVIVSSNSDSHRPPALEYLSLSGV